MSTPAPPRFRRLTEVGRLDSATTLLRHLTSHVVCHAISTLACEPVDRWCGALPTLREPAAARLVLAAHEPCCTKPHDRLPEPVPWGWALDALIRELNHPPVTNAVSCTLTCELADELAVAAFLLAPRSSTAENLLAAHGSACAVVQHADLTTGREARAWLRATCA